MRRFAPRQLFIDPSLALRLIRRLPRKSTHDSTTPRLHYSTTPPLRTFNLGQSVDNARVARGRDFRLDYKDMGWLPAESEDDDVSALRLEEAQRLAQETSEDAKPVGSTLTGNIRFHRDVPSRFLHRSRDVIVYLPPNYEENTAVSYPVLYLQDGQNLFDAATAYVPGHDWKADGVGKRNGRADYRLVAHSRAEAGYE